MRKLPFHEFPSISPVYSRVLPCYSIGGYSPLWKPPHDYGFLSCSEMGRGTRGTNRRVLRRVGDGGSRCWMVVSMVMNDGDITSWLVVWLPSILFSQKNIGFLIIPIDELIFFRGVAEPPTSDEWWWHNWWFLVISMGWKKKSWAISCGMVVISGDCTVCTKKYHFHSLHVFMKVIS